MIKTEKLTSIVWTLLVISILKYYE